MKKIVCFISVVVLLLSLSVSTFAAAVVPSIEEKKAPELAADANGIVGHITTASGEALTDEKEDCIKITPVTDTANEDLKKAYAEIKDAKKLSDVFKDLKDADKLVVRDLFEISLVCDHADKLTGGNLLNVTFKMNVKADVPVYAMLKANGTWKQVTVKNNGNGTVTAALDSEGVVAFLVPASSVGMSPDTGDSSSLTLWISLLAGSLVLIVMVAVLLRKRTVNAK